LAHRNNRRLKSAAILDIVLDADERISPTGGYHKKIVTDSNVKEAGSAFPQELFSRAMDQACRLCRIVIIRLFAKKQAGDHGIVHESVKFRGCRALEAAIEHYTESRLSKIIQKLINIQLWEPSRFSGGKEIFNRRSFYARIFHFYSGLFFPSGILDGMPADTAVTDSVNKFFKYAKLSELVKINVAVEHLRQEPELISKYDIRGLKNAFILSGQKMFCGGVNDQ